MKNYHVPLVFSHPKLPHVEISNAVHSSQILPTILDLLIESSSVNEGSVKILKDLLPIYQGQTMLRKPVIPEEDHHRDWHFTTMNPGGSWIAMRSTSRPYRLIVPLLTNAKWRFTDLETDKLEMKPVTHHDVVSLVDSVQERYGPQAAQWVIEAANVAKWWLPEHYRLWQYDPLAPKQLSKELLDSAHD